MSSTLTIEPALRKKTILPYDLKKILQKRFKGVVSEILITIDDVSYFKALVDSEIDGAELVIEFIEKYGECILDERF